jgi:hypothetical protein
MRIFAKPAPGLLRLPSGSFTVDRGGRVVIGTVPSTFPAELMEEIGQHVLTTFREAQQAQLPLSELSVEFPSLKIVARELRGGAVIFLSPKSLVSTSRPT